MSPRSAAPAQHALSARSFGGFLAVGMLATLLHYAIAVVCAWLLGVPAAFASSIGYALSALVNYALNARYIFVSRERHHRTAPRFALVSGSGLMLNTLAMSWLMALGLSAAPAQLITTAVTTAWGYLVNALWTFRRPC